MVQCNKDPVRSPQIFNCSIVVLCFSWLDNLQLVCLMKHTSSWQPQSSLKQERGVFPVYFLRKDSHTPITDHSVLTMHIYTGLKGTSQSLLAPVHMWQTVSHTLLQAEEVTSKDAIIYTFLIKRRSTECLKTYRWQNGSFRTQGIFVLGVKSHTRGQSSIKKCHFLFLHSVKTAATHYSPTCSLQLSLWQPTALPLQCFPHPTRSLLSTCIWKCDVIFASLFLCGFSLDS